MVLADEGDDLPTSALDRALDDIAAAASRLHAAGKQESREDACVSAHFIGGLAEAVRLRRTNANGPLEAIEVITALLKEAC